MADRSEVFHDGFGAKVGAISFPQSVQFHLGNALRGLRVIVS
jgi:hypothetical protein